MIRRQLIIQMAAATVLLVAPSVQAEFVTQPKDKLRGSADLGMAVVIEDLGPKESECGLVSDIIRADIEKKMNAGGLKVVSINKYAQSAERISFLYLNINAAFIENSPSVVYNVTLDVDREAILIPEAVLEVTKALVRKGFNTLCDKSNDESIKAAENLCEQEKMSTDKSSLKPLQNKISCYSTVWHKEYLGLTSSKKLKKTIDELINNLLNEFLEDYKAANTKKAIEKKEMI